MSAEEAYEIDLFDPTPFSDVGRGISLEQAAKETRARARGLYAEAVALEKDHGDTERAMWKLRRALMYHPHFLDARRALDRLRP
jgi:hypothetical protein